MNNSVDSAAPKSPRKPRATSPPKQTLNQIILLVAALIIVIIIVAIGILSRDDAPDENESPELPPANSYVWKSIPGVRTDDEIIGHSQLLSWEVVDDSNIEVHFELENNSNQEYQIPCYIVYYGISDIPRGDLFLFDRKPASYFDSEMLFGRTKKKHISTVPADSAWDVTGINLGCLGNYYIWNGSNKRDEIIIPKANDSQIIKAAIRNRINQTFTKLGDLEDVLGIKGLSPTKRFSVDLMTSETYSGTDRMLTKTDTYLKLTNGTDADMTIVCYTAIIGDSRVHNDYLEWSNLKPRESNSSIIIYMWPGAAKPYFNCRGYQ